MTKHSYLREKVRSYEAMYFSLPPDHASKIPTKSIRIRFYIRYTTRGGSTSYREFHLEKGSGLKQDSASDYASHAHVGTGTV